MPQDSPGTVYIGSVRTVPWVHTLIDLANNDSTVHSALSAVSLTITGRVHSDPVLLQESTRLYGRALGETNLALQDPVKAQSDDVLACCKTLAMYVKQIEPKILVLTFFPGTNNSGTQTLEGSLRKGLIGTDMLTG
jgi:hypothetical protein